MFDSSTCRSDLEAGYKRQFVVLPEADFFKTNNDVHISSLLSPPNKRNAGLSLHPALKVDTLLRTIICNARMFLYLSTP